MNLHTTLSRAFIAIFLIVSFSFTSRAQYVAIPDSNFGNWLHGNGYSACMTGNSASGWHLDTTCTAVVNARHISCTGYSITDLTGITHFSNLRYLECSNNSIDSITALPSSLDTLICSNSQIRILSILPDSLISLECASNGLSSLPTLPARLARLDCSRNQLSNLSSLPATLIYFDLSYNHLSSVSILPAPLQEFHCDYNPLVSLPALPASLTWLDCSGDTLITIPSILPSTLQGLICDNMHLSSLPANLPASIRVLSCSGNPLINLPTLPASLNDLSCEYCQLTSLPSLPASLFNLDCSINPLVSLPALPASLGQLRCTLDQLQSLPALPASLTYLDCEANPLLSCLPRIYQNQLNSFYINGTNIHCLPNSFTATYYDVMPDTMPLCSAASGCGFYYNITGNIHSDTAGSCTADSLYPGSNLKNIKVQLSKYGNVVQQFYTFSSGEYSFKTDSLTRYDVSIDTIGLPLIVSCPANEHRTVQLSTADSVEYNESFGMKCKGVDNGVSSINGFFRAARQSMISIDAGDIAMAYGLYCDNHNAGTLTSSISGSVQYLRPAAGAMTPTVSGNTLVYHVADFDNLSPGAFDIVILTDTHAVVGSTVCVTVGVTTLGFGVVDINSSNNNLTQCFQIYNSYDPNLKTVYPLTTVDTGRQWLTYTVHFQNTGNDTSYTVIIKDTLSQYLDASSFQYLASSHKAVIQLFGNAMVFTFPKINLVDSNQNEPLSHGWIQYKVKTIANLPLSTQIKNTASIYFDLNPAVKTNTTVNTVSLHTGIETVSETAIMHLYPNPNSGSFTLETTNQIGMTYIITDMLGQIVQEKTITSDRQYIDMSTSSPGIYTLMLRGKTGAVRVVVR